MNLWRRIYRERRGVALPLAALLIANAAVFGLVVLPLEGSVSSANNRSIDSLTALASARLEANNAKKALASKQRADLELKKFYQEILPTNFPAARDQADFELARIAHDAGVTKKNSQYEVDAVKDSRLVRVTGKIVLDGDYSNIRRFLYEAEAAHAFLVIEKVELSQPSSTDNGPSSSGANMIEVDLDVATYYLAGQGSAAK